MCGGRIAKGAIRRIAAACDAAACTPRSAASDADCARTVPTNTPSRLEAAIVARANRQAALTLSRTRRCRSRYWRRRANTPVSMALEMPKQIDTASGRPATALAAPVTSATISTNVHHCLRGVHRMNSTDTPAAGHHAATLPPWGVTSTLSWERTKIAMAARIYIHQGSAFVGADPCALCGARRRPSMKKTYPAPARSGGAHSGPQRCFRYPARRSKKPMSRRGVYSVSFRVAMMVRMISNSSAWVSPARRGRSTPRFSSSSSVRVTVIASGRVVPPVEPKASARRLANPAYAAGSHSGSDRGPAQ